MNLTEFLLARIAEDEAVARAGAGEPVYPHYGDTAAEESVEMALGEGCAEEGPEHLRRWLPARVLAECEAKRRIVELHQPIWASDIEWADCAICPSALASGGWPCPALRYLAAPFADHPDFDPTWRP